MTLREFVVAAGSLELLGLVAVLVALARPRRKPLPRKGPRGEATVPMPVRRPA